jgi:alpha-L-rhamnosidase
MVAGFVLLVAMSTNRVGTPPALQVEHLRCEYLVDPIGVDLARPRLSWQAVATDKKLKNLSQSAYAVLVASSPKLLTPGKADLWDSGEVASSECFGIVYGGKPLSPATTAYWKVRLVDGSGAPSAWSKTAQWTSGPKWRAKWVQHIVDLGDETEAAANNGFHGAVSPTPDSTEWVQIDLGSSQPVDAVKLWPARPYDFTDTPGFLFPVRFKVEVSDDAALGSATAFSTLTASDFPNPGTQTVDLRGNGKGRYVRLTVTRLARRDAETCAFALAEMQVLSGGKVVSGGKPVSASESVEGGAWSKGRLVDGVTVSHGPVELKALPATQVRKEFTLPAKVKRAVAYATALGVYEMRINGKRVGDHILAPEWTDYRDRVQYQGYDVTKLLKQGANAVAAFVGDGWYAGRVAWFGRARWGRVPAFMCQIEIELADNTRRTFVSDGSWLSTVGGPIRSSDILDGEVYDARKELRGWDQAGLAATNWSRVRTPKQEVGKLVAQPNEPIRVVQELKAVSITQIAPGVYVADMGQNMVGWVRATLRGKAGTTAQLRYAEALNDDGTIYRDNLRGAPQIDTYTFASDSPEVFEPHFTYHGFRYVEITGVTRKPGVGDVAGRVFCSSSPTVGSFECSDPMLTRLWLNIYWTQRANMMSSPTDCPQRDERLGWCGDIQAFGQTAAYSMDMDGFFAKWSQDLRDSQSTEGLYPEFSPWPSAKNTMAGSPAWSDAGVFVPWTAYANYGDKGLIAAHYESAKKYVDFLHRNNPDGLWLNRRGSDFNDWLNGDTISQEGWPNSGGSVPPEVLATAFMARSTQLVADMASALGRASDAAKYGGLARKSREAFCRTFVDAEVRIKGETQAGYALALSFDLLPVDLRKTAAEHMVEAVHKYNDHLSTGIQTSHRLMLELSRWGYNDLAYKLALSKSFPGWGYSVENGATTIWERWDGYVKGRGFQNPGMNSLNHWAIGSVGEWMMKAIGGLWPGDEHGWAHPVLRPMPAPGVTWAKATYDSVRGRIQCDWRMAGGVFSMSVTVPVGVTATVVVPCRTGSKVTAQGARLVKREDAAWVYEVGSGTYRFEVSK